MLELLLFIRNHHRNLKRSFQLDRCTKSYLIFPLLVYATLHTLRGLTFTIFSLILGTNVVSRRKYSIRTIDT